MKKSQAEELNDILCQPKDQHFDDVQENVLTCMKQEMTKGISKSLEVLSKLTSILFC